MIPNRVSPAFNAYNTTLATESGTVAFGVQLANWIASHRQWAKRLVFERDFDGRTWTAVDQVTTQLRNLSAQIDDAYDVVQQVMLVHARKRQFLHIAKCSWTRARNITCVWHIDSGRARRRSPNWLPISLAMLFSTTNLLIALCQKLKVWKNRLQRISVEAFSLSYSA